MKTYVLGRIGPAVSEWIAGSNGVLHARFRPTSRPYAGLKTSSHLQPGGLIDYRPTLWKRDNACSRAEFRSDTNRRWTLKSPELIDRFCLFSFGEVLLDRLVPSEQAANSK